MTNETPELSEGRMRLAALLEIALGSDEWTVGPFYRSAANPEAAAHLIKGGGSPRIYLTHVLNPDGVSQACLEVHFLACGSVPFELQFIQIEPDGDNPDSLKCMLSDVSCEIEQAAKAHPTMITPSRLEAILRVLCKPEPAFKEVTRTFTIGQLRRMGVAVPGDGSKEAEFIEDTHMRVAWTREYRRRVFQDPDNQTLWAIEYHIDQEDRSNQLDSPGVFCPSEFNATKVEPIVRPSVTFEPLIVEAQQ